jgi:Cu(I)/Ag(I) efflux system membrane protein CusA/SilA
MSAIGGENVSTTIEGRERYPSTSATRASCGTTRTKLARVLVPTVRARRSRFRSCRHPAVEGPHDPRRERPLSGYVYVDVDTESATSAATSTEAKAAFARGLKLPHGYTLAWSGQYEAMERVRES